MLLKGSILTYREEKIKRNQVSISNAQNNTQKLFKIGEMMHWLRDVHSAG